MKKIIGHFKYNTFGFRKHWMEGVFRDGTAFLESQSLGPRQRDALVCYLRDCELIDRNRNTTPLFSLLKKLYAREGIDSKTLWAILWVNLFYNSLLFHWYALLPKGHYSRQKMLDRMAQDYGKFNRYVTNGYVSLMDTFNKSPIGPDLGLGIIKKKGQSREITKACKNNVPPFIILYALFKFAFFRDIFSFLFGEVVDDPYFVTHIFCQGLDSVEDLLLSIESPEFFASDIVEGNLALRLTPGRIPLDVLRAFL